MKEPQKDSYYVRSFFRFLAGISCLLGVVIIGIVIFLVKPRPSFDSQEEKSVMFTAILATIYFGKIAITGNAKLFSFKKNK